MKIILSIVSPFARLVSNKIFTVVDLDTSGGLSELCVSLLETLSDRQMQIKYELNSS